jgi:Protein of unknown function (DUF4058)
MPSIRSIKNQYRGINAHLHSRLQTEGGWDSFHTIHISHLTTALQIQLAPLGYEADIEQSLQIRRSLEPARYPTSDVTIYDPDLSRQYQPVPVTSNMQEIVMPIPDLLSLRDEEIKTYKAVGLYQAVPADSERGDPIAWIEILSPSNKPTGRDFESYRDKRTKVLQTGIIFVELDYLHQYPPTFKTVPDYFTFAKNRRSDPGAHPYRITVIDPHPDFFEGEGRSRQFDVDEPIPNVRIPLNAGDVLDFDFGNVYHRTFEEMLYGNKVDYSQLPLNFEMYSPNDQARIVTRMLTVLETSQKGDNLERHPQTVETLPLDVGLNRLRAFKN